MYHAVDKDWIVALSPSLRDDLGYFAGALTSYDNYKANYYPRSCKNLIYKEKTYYVDLIPKNERTLVKKIVIKAKRRA